MFCMLIKVHGNLKFVENVGVSVVKNGCGHSVLRTLRLAVFKKKLLDFTGFLCGN